MLCLACLCDWLVCLACVAYLFVCLFGFFVGWASFVCWACSFVRLVCLFGFFVCLCVFICVFRSQLLNNHWFHCVFAPSCWKRNGFTRCSLNKVEKRWFSNCSLTNVSKMNVLRTLRSKTHIKVCKEAVFWSKNCLFSEKPCARMQKL